MRRLILAVALTALGSSPALAQSVFEQRRAAREQARSDSAEPSQTARPRSPSRDRGEQGDVGAPGALLMPRASDHPRRPAMDGAVERGLPSLGNDPRSRFLGRRREAGDGVANWRREERDQLRGHADGLARDSSRPRIRPPADARPDRPAPPPRTTLRHRDTPRWRHDWHRDRRHDWRDHRRRFGSLFRWGFYFDPFGWNYRRHGIGWRLWPSYYERSYWLSDPFMYRLPHAPYPYKWVRYWDDALLVDTWNGEVVDVVHDFFW